MRKGFLLLSLILVFYSCHLKKPGPYKGYETQDGITYYKYVDLGIKTGRISPGKTMEVYISYARMNDSVFWDSRNSYYPFTLLLPYDSLVNSTTYRNILLKCNEGDSINFIVKKSTLPFAINPMEPLRLHYHFLGADTMIKVHVRVVSILDSNQLKPKMKEHALISNDKEMREQYELTRYLILTKVPDSDNIGDIYLIPLVNGAGPEVSNNCRVSISYTGYFTNNKVFDSIPVSDPLDFIIGDASQVINGLEKGIKKMRRGEVAKIIIPSHSAFGEKGSSTGIVPPYTTLVYEVRMLKVQRL